MKQAKQIFMNDKRILAFIPFFFWLLLIMAELIRIVSLLNGDDLINGLYLTFFSYILDITTFSVFYYVIFPKIFNNKKKIITIVLGIIYWILFGFVHVLVFTIVEGLETIEDKIIVYKTSMSCNLLSTLYALVLRLSVDWIRKIGKHKELEKQNSIMRLALLRSQINPHFLFNTLNNINSFSSRNPEKASYATRKLSGIMHYMLNEANNEKVLLDKEIEHINNFIALQKLRFKETNFVVFNIEGETSGILVPPMIFLPFIENAFKHGSVVRKNSIDILIKLSSNEIWFKCRNIKKQLTVTEKSQKSGIGLKNIKQRLELLYPHKHSLRIENSDNEYKVELMLK